MMADETFHLTSMDPGATTGLTLMTITPDTFTVEHQLAEPYDPDNGFSPVNVLRAWRAAHPTWPHTFVYEDFHIRPGRRIPNTTALTVIDSVNRWINTEHPYTHVIKQQPAMAKRLATDTVLTRLDLRAYGRHAAHINDSFRHSVTYLATRQYKPLCIAAWPPRTASAS